MASTRDLSAAGIRDLAENNETGLLAVAGAVAVEKLADPGDAGVILPAGTGTALCVVLSAGAETRTLGVPVQEGQRLILAFDSVGGLDTVVISGNLYGYTSITLSDPTSSAAAGGVVELISANVRGGLQWIVTGAFNDLDSGGGDVNRGALLTV